MKLLTFIAALVLAHATLANAQPSGEEREAEKPVPTDEQIQQWITQLGDEDFQTREAAQTLLIDSGHSAYFALAANPLPKDAETRERLKRVRTALEMNAVEDLRNVGAHFGRRDDAHESMGVRKFNRLAINKRPIKEDQLAPLVCLPHLELVSIKNAQISDDALIYLDHLSSLKVLTLYNTPITDEGLITITTVTELESLDLTNTQVTSEGIKALEHCERLSDLSLSYTSIDGTGLANLFPLRNRLERLHLEGTRLTDDDLTHLSEFRKLKTLRLNFTNVRGRGLAHISGLPNLESLLLQGVELDEEMLVHIAKLPNLERLYLRDTGVSVQGLRLLMTCRKLTSVSVSENAVTEQEVNELQDQFDMRNGVSDLRVDRRRGQLPRLFSKEG